MEGFVVGLQIATSNCPPCCGNAPHHLTGNASRMGAAEHIWEFENTEEAAGKHWKEVFAAFRTTIS